MAPQMKARFYDWVKLFLENPRVIVATYFLLFSTTAGLGAYGFMDKNEPVVEPVVEIVEAPVCSCSKELNLHIIDLH